jgi:hypothetical protein
MVWSKYTGATLIVNPEEAEAILPILRAVKQPVCHLLSYSAAVTRKMNQFNDMKFYAVPALPRSWTAPQWLTLEVGFLAGRLYFPFHEYDAVRKFFGLKPDPQKETNGLGAKSDIAEVPAEANEGHSSPALTYESETWSLTSSPMNTAPTPPPEKIFTEKPMVFLREWLAIRRGGNNFKHTPMGYLCDGRQLSSNHPYFRSSSVAEEEGD